MLGFPRNEKGGESVSFANFKSRPFLSSWIIGRFGEGFSWANLAPVAQKNILVKIGIRGGGGGGSFLNYNPAPFFAGIITRNGEKGEGGLKASFCVSRELSGATKREFFFFSRN